MFLCDFEGTMDDGFLTLLGGRALRVSFYGFFGVPCWSSGVLRNNILSLTIVMSPSSTLQLKLF